jgi:spore germination cell wall hydrolase CwlJ-like protein
MSLRRARKCPVAAPLDHLLAGLRPNPGREAGSGSKGRDREDDEIRQSFDRWRRAGLAAALAVAALCGCTPASKHAATPEARALAAHGLTDIALISATANFDPATLSIAQRFDPGLRRADLWGRPAGWDNLDLRKIPDLGLPAAEGDEAVAMNNLRPFAGLPIRAMRPFVLTADADDSARALHCMTQAIYYEAAREPVRGQQAVAQVVLNRLRHPAYPKSICGVVYQGAARPTGCQFTFTCDGALRWAPQAALWRQAQGVARRALAGFVDKDVGSATHYHAAYVVPYWAPTLVKMTQVGQHIFYRWTGSWGEPSAFTGHYAGREAELTPAVLASAAPTAAELAPEPRKVTLAVAGGEARTYQVADPGAAPSDGARQPGALYAARRQPTPEEIRQINAKLAARFDPKPVAIAQAAPAAAIPGQD